MNLLSRYFVLSVALCLTLAKAGTCADWPTWRSDPQRSGAISEELPEELNLLWVRDLGTPKPCWPYTQYKLQFDKSYEPVVVGKRLFVGSMVEDCVTAYDTDTGEELWRTYTDGPVRFAPAAWGDKVYFTSDDGHLYCAGAEDGKILWTVRGGPTDRKVFGNERLISMWPARGAPVVYDGTVYFAAGIWPFMGVYIHAVDAESGERVWMNSGSSSSYILQPHSSPAFAGIAPQGYLAIDEDRLFVAGGRSIPAIYDRHTGELLIHDPNTKYGGYEVVVGQDHYCSFGTVFDGKNGNPVNFQFARACVLEGTRLIESQMPIRPRAYGLEKEGMIRSISLDPEWVETKDRRGRTRRTATFPTEWELKKPINRVFLKAGSKIACGTPGMVALVDVPEPGTGVPEVGDDSSLAWKADIEGAPFTALVADDKLFVVTEGGNLYCYGAEKQTPTVHAKTVTVSESDDTWKEKAKTAIGRAGSSDGYALLLGAGTGGLAEAIVEQSEFHLVVFEPDAEKVDALRRQWTERGIYGRRITLVPERITDSPLPPYFANAVFSEDFDSAGAENESFAEVVFDVLRPYGGTAVFEMAAEPRDAFRQSAKDLGHLNAKVRITGDGLNLTKAGSLPGSAPWTHQYGDASNSVFSRDKLAKAPLGILWFGGPSHEDVLPRHGHGPPEQVIGGRLFIQGIGVLSARDVYTGRVLWRKELPNLNTFDMYYTESYVDDPYDLTYNQRHAPGANAFGSNFVATEDLLYLAQEEELLVIDSTDGRTLKKFRLPPLPGAEKPNWGYLGVEGDLLIAGAAPYRIEGDDDDVVVRENNRFGVGSKNLVVMDRKTGKVHWTVQAKNNFRHNTIVAGNGKVFCLDGLSPKRAALLKRRGLTEQANSEIIAFELETGKEIWRTEENVFGTWLGYSTEHDVLFQGGSESGDRAGDEIESGMVALRGADGTELWKNDLEYRGPCMLYHDRLITQTGGSNTHAPPALAFNILTGDTLKTTHPLTGDEVDWNWVRFKGCNTAIASEHLLTFRSASAAFVDLQKGQGTATIGGFRSGCTSNLIAADGVLNSPDYTRTCTCAYQNQTSLALVHMPELDPVGHALEEWSFNFYQPPTELSRVRTAGINLGAPGDRFAENRTLWTEFPSVGGPSPEIPVSIESEAPGFFRSHASEIEGASSTHRWVVASGFEGEGTVTIQPFLLPEARYDDIEGFERSARDPYLDGSAEIPEASVTETVSYTVRLHFAETRDVAEGQRLFEVALQGKTVLEKFDVVRAAGGTGRGVVREFAGIEVADKLVVELKSANPGNDLAPILSGVEISVEE